MVTNAKRPVVKVDKMTREVVERHPSAKAASEAADATMKNVGSMCRVRSISNGRYYYRYEDEFDPDEDFTGKFGCPVVVMDMRTGEVSWYSSTRAASDELFIHISAISKAKKQGKPFGWHYVVRDAPLKVNLPRRDGEGDGE